MLEEKTKRILTGDVSNGNISVRLAYTMPQRFELTIDDSNLAITVRIDYDQMKKLYQDIKDYIGD